MPFALKAQQTDSSVAMAKVISVANTDNMVAVDETSNVESDRPDGYGQSIIVCTIA